MKALSFCAAVLCVATTGCQSVPVAKADAGHDLRKMTRIENAARASGVTVIWINPPLLDKVAIVRN